MKKIIVIVIIAAIAGGAGFAWMKKKNAAAPMRFIQPEQGTIAVELRETGTVSPRNRLEIKPPISGRIEQILVVEGQTIKKGEIIAWMSSTDRAALLDAARSKGEEELKKWEDTYKQTAIIAPLDGFIIARKKEPGQTVGTADDIVVMADTLIIESAMDETDLRYIHLEMNVALTLDAYPDMRFEGVVEHIAYESEVMNNVTIYKVKIRPLKAPRNFRAGMTATIDIEANRKDNALLLPPEALLTRDDGKYVMVKNGEEQPTPRKVEVGITTSRKAEILSGITLEDMVGVAGKSRKRDRQAQGQTRMVGFPGMGGRR